MTNPGMKSKIKDKMYYNEIEAAKTFYFVFSNFCPRSRQQWNS
jgi:hypothetical protein